MSWTEGAYEGCLHSESVIREKLFIGVKFGHECLEVSIQPFSYFFKFMNSEGGGLKGRVKVLNCMANSTVE